MAVPWLSSKQPASCKGVSKKTYAASGALRKASWWGSTCSSTTSHLKWKIQKPRIGKGTARPSGAPHKGAVARGIPHRLRLYNSKLKRKCSKEVFSREQLMGYYAQLATGSGQLRGERTHGDPIMQRASQRRQEGQLRRAPASGGRNG